MLRSKWTLVDRAVRGNSSHISFPSSVITIRNRFPGTLYLDKGSSVVLSRKEISITTLDDFLLHNFSLTSHFSLPFLTPLLLPQSVLINLQKEFMQRPNASSDTAVQKIKKQKQAIEVIPSSRKDSVDGSSINNKENVNQTNAITDNDESTAMDSTASLLNQRPVRIRRTKLDNLVSLVQRLV